MRTERTRIVYVFVDENIILNFDTSDSLLFYRRVVSKNNENVFKKRAP